MMKKLLPLSALAIGVMFSAQASATIGSFATTAPITPDASGALYCASLSNNVTIQLSKGVVAAYNCADNGTSFTAATCHTTGTNKQQTVTCVYTDDGSGNFTTDTSTQCPAWTATLTDAEKIVTFQGRIGYSGGSAGGSVAAAQIDGTTCDTTAAESLVPTP